MWRGQNWRSSLPSLKDDCNEANKIDVDSENFNTLTSDAQEFSALSLQKNSVDHLSSESHDTSISSSSGDVSLCQVEESYPIEDGNLSVSMVPDAASLSMRTCEVETADDIMGSFGEPPPSGSTSPSVTMLGTSDNSINDLVYPSTDELLDSSGAADVSQLSRSAAPCTEGVLLLLEQAVEEGSALVLDDEYLDADNVYQTTVAFAKSAPSGPVFSLPRKVIQKSDKQEKSTSKTKEITTVMIKDKMEKTRKSSKIQRKEDFDERQPNIVPRGTIRIDEPERFLT